MSIDDHDPRIPWSVASYLEKDPIDYNHRDWEYHNHLQQTACESVEAEEAKWHHPVSGIFPMMSRERPRVHYDDGTSG